MKRRISTELLKIIMKNKENLKDSFSKIIRKNPRKDVIEKVIIQKELLKEKLK